uniref:BHLH domain-containing protein n=1 Tax=Trichuris muris TaxID=70415 RepID=A0A5S6QSD8_TRIMR
MYWPPSACSNGPCEDSTAAPAMVNYGFQAKDSFWPSWTTAPQCAAGSTPPDNAYDLAFSDFVHISQGEMRNPIIWNSSDTVRLDGHAETVKLQCDHSAMAPAFPCGNGEANIHGPKESVRSAERDNRARMRNLLKERRRSEAIRKAFKELKFRIPYIPMDKSVTQIKTLRLAIQYIRHLEAQLGSNQCSEDKSSNFADVVVAEIRRKNSYVKASRKL